MESIQSISDYVAIKVLSDPRRLKILRALMTTSATLTQLGKEMGMHPARVRYHLKLLEEAGLVKLVSTEVVKNYIEKYYQATAKSFNIQISILPQSYKENIILVSGSHDLALDLLAEKLSQDEKSPSMYTLPVGSLDGLIALRQGLCHMVGCHLYDPVGREYNTSYVRHIFPDQLVHIITLAHRQQGLLVQARNPQEIKGLEDLHRDDIALVNRNRGSGTRLWLDQNLQNLGINKDSIRGYGKEVNTHIQVAEAVRSGEADVGLGIFAAAMKVGLDFIPLFEERFDLVLLEEQFRSQQMIPAFDLIQSGSFQHAVETLAGYQTGSSGQEIYVNTLGDK
jgi:putative molybdopterin biosynthesis protein